MIPMNRIRHVILDRDGVLNVERHGDYVRDRSQWQWIPGAREGLAMLSLAGMHISVATNQSGIGRGAMSRADVDAIHARMLEEAAAAGGIIERVLVCPHAPGDDCACRKPLPGLFLQAIQAAGIPGRATIAVGDDLRDLEAAWAAGIRAVLLRTGKGRVTEAVVPAGKAGIFDDLRAFAAASLSSAALEATNIP